jgi:AcrR family transcriptional regulator
MGQFPPYSRRSAAPGSGAVPHRQRARKGEGDKLRTEVLDAAEALLLEKGSVDAVSMRAIAQRIGVSPPAIYLHFEDKDELFFESCNRRFLRMAEEMQEAAAGIERPAEKMRAMGRAYIDVALARPEQYEVMMLGADSVKNPTDMPGAQTLLIVAEVVREGMAEGRFRKDLDPLATAVSLWASVHGAVTILLARRRNPVDLFDDEEAVIEHVLGIVSRGLLA